MTIYDKVALIECALKIAYMDRDIAQEILIRLYHTEVECANCPLSQKCVSEKVCDCERFVKHELFSKE